MKKIYFLLYLLSPLFAIAKNAALLANNIGFNQNKGQVTDQYYNVRTDIDYCLSTGKDLSIFVGSSGLHYQFRKVSSKTESKPPRRLGRIDHHYNKVTYDMYRMDVELVGANRNASIVEEQKFDDYETYYTHGTNHRSVLVNKYRKITYKNIYPNIDWVLYFNDNGFKHEFIVYPGGHVADIRLKYGGQSSLEVCKTGELVATSPLGNITEGMPVSWQENGQHVATRYSLQNNIVCFAVAKYSGKLVIDPAIIWSTYYGGDGEDVVSDLANDDNGNTYISGSCMSASNIATTGVYQATYNGGRDAFVAKFNYSGARLWGSYFGGLAEESANSIAVDKTGAVYICGGNDDISGGLATPGAFQESCNSLTDAFLAKFFANGMLSWATYYGGESDDYAYALAVDTFCSVYMVGGTYSQGAIASPGSFDTSLYGVGDEDGWMAKFDSSGARLWATYYGTDGVDVVGNIIMGLNNDFFIVGGTDGNTGLATTGAYMEDNLADQGSFLARFNLNGERIWSTYVSAWSALRLFAVNLDSASNIYVAGFTNSNYDNMICTPGAFQDSLWGDFDGYLAKFSPSGAKVWSTYYGGVNRDEIDDVAVDKVGNVFILGTTESHENIATPGSYKPVMTDAVLGLTDAFLAKFTSDGARLWGTYFGGSNMDFAVPLAIDTGGNACFAGYTFSTDNIATPGSLQPVGGGSLWDGFVTKFNGSGALIINQTKSSGTFSVSPNPATDNIAISATQPLGRVSILNMLSQIVYSEETIAKTLNVDVSKFPSGVYIISLNDGEQYKFLKQ